MELLKELSTDFLGMILPALLSLLAAYAAYGINKGVGWLNIKTQAIADNRQRILLWTALEDVSELTHKTVSAIEQTTAKALREQVKDGFAHPEALSALASQAALEIRASLSDDAAAIIRKHYGNVNAYISNCIETKVLELKRAGQGA